jgi:hypothetical protein
MMYHLRDMDNFNNLSFWTIQINRGWEQNVLLIDIFHVNPDPWIGIFLEAKMLLINLICIRIRILSTDWKNKKSFSSK